MVDYAGCQGGSDGTPPFAASRTRPTSAGRLVAWLGRAIHMLMLWNKRSKQRSELIELPPHLLFDIGLTRAAVEEEARKRPWQGASLRESLQHKRQGELDAQDQR
jgi:uncharacterized protein YjiS (DUF1127 family)